MFDNYLTFNNAPEGQFINFNDIVPSFNYDKEL